MVYILHTHIKKDMCLKAMERARKYEEMGIKENNTKYKKI